MHLFYYPGESEYSSYAYGLMAATATAILSGFSIYGLEKEEKNHLRR